VLITISNKKDLKNVGPICHYEPPHALILHCHSPGVATVVRCLPINVHDNDDNNAWQRGPLWPHRMGPTTQNAWLPMLSLSVHMYAQWFIRFLLTIAAFCLRCNNDFQSVLMEEAMKRGTSSVDCICVTMSVPCLLHCANCATTRLSYLFTLSSLCTSCWKLKQLGEEVFK